jgi:MiaB/RimO family radical SAM methylthiotransferase
MKTFSIQTLGCKVNHYESEQLAQLLRERGLRQTEPAAADLRVINTCSVTTAAASQSRQAVRRVVRLPLLDAPAAAQPLSAPSQGAHQHGAFGAAGQTDARSSLACGGDLTAVPLTTVLWVAPSTRHSNNARPRVLVSGCWATSDREAAQQIPGVDAVLGHHHNIARELDRLLEVWQRQDSATSPVSQTSQAEQLPGPDKQNDIDGWIKEAGATESHLTRAIKSSGRLQVNQIFVEKSHKNSSDCIGTTTLPLLGQRQSGRQRAVLKIQDGCDAHCTYCIIPTLRPSLWSKPLDHVVDEARALVAAGHVEIVLTGIFLGAYGQTTALRRRQQIGADKHLGRLVEALCTQVSGLRRLRLSSLEAGDLSDELIAIFRAHHQLVPHFHLPLQSGSDLILRRMNRQYTRDDFLQMIDRLHEAFDRPALTTDIVVGFPGEDDAEFEQTAEVVRQANFIHVHAFPYSPRPGTAAARWSDQFIYGPEVNERIERLRQIAQEQSVAFRQSFLNEVVEVIVEKDDLKQAASTQQATRHGRCERYFDVSFNDPTAIPGDVRQIQLKQVTLLESRGDLLDSQRNPKHAVPPTEDQTDHDK